MSESMGEGIGGLRIEEPSIVDASSTVGAAATKLGDDGEVEE
jgi:hypothetical protein